MKKNKGLIIGIVIIIILAAVVWYFFFRNSGAAKIGSGTDVTPQPTPGPLDQYVCPAGTSGTYPDCKLDIVTPDAIFAKALVDAKKEVTNNASLTNTQKVNAINVIDVFVPNDKDTLLAGAAAGGDLVQLILTDAEKIYLTQFGSEVKLSQASRASSGKG